MATYYKNNNQFPVEAAYKGITQVVKPTELIEGIEFEGNPALTVVASPSPEELANVVYSYSNPVSKLDTTSGYANNATALADGVQVGSLYYTDISGEYVVKIAH